MAALLLGGCTCYISMVLNPVRENLTEALKTRTGRGFALGNTIVHIRPSLTTFLADSRNLSATDNFVGSFHAA